MDRAANGDELKAPKSRSALERAERGLWLALKWVAFVVLFCLARGFVGCMN